MSSASAPPLPARASRPTSLPASPQITPGDASDAYRTLLRERDGILEDNKVLAKGIQGLGERNKLLTKQLEEKYEKAPLLAERDSLRQENALLAEKNDVLHARVLRLSDELREATDKPSSQREKWVSGQSVDKYCQGLLAEYEEAERERNRVQNLLAVTIKELESAKDELKAARRMILDLRGHD